MCAFFYSLYKSGGLVTFSLGVRVSVGDVDGLLDGARVEHVDFFVLVVVRKKETN